MSKTYYPVVNDLIGGWDVSLHNKTTAAHNHMYGEHTLAWGMSETTANMVAEALNMQERTRMVRFVLQSVPDTPNYEFVETETLDGEGIRAGRWVELHNGFSAIEFAAYIPDAQ